MLEFSNEIIVSKNYKVSVKGFMENHFHEAHRCKNELDVYVKSNINNGYMSRVFCITLLPNEMDLDFDNKDDVAKVLLRYAKGE